jgi:hypothetical protein
MQLPPQDLANSIDLKAIRTGAKQSDTLIG